MTEQEILESAREAEIIDRVFYESDVPLESLQRFAAIIEAKTLERAALVCEEAGCECCWTEEGNSAFQEAAAAIRALKETK